MDYYNVRILPGGRITIPAEIRRSLDLHPGDALIWWWEDREIHFRKAEPGEPDTHDGRPTADEAISSDVSYTSTTEEE